MIKKEGRMLHSAHRSVVVQHSFLLPVPLSIQNIVDIGQTGRFSRRHPGTSLARVTPFLKANGQW
jgi:hypothetical protein